jgi:polysaccharide pyruvyl transferase WcaK-like protein
MNRRTALQALAGTLGAAALGLRSTLRAETPKRILLRSSWQTVNIGDIAHTPGVLKLLEEFVPEAEVRLWPSSVDNGVEELLKRRFPKLTIAKSPEAVNAALAECDFLLHGSGPSMVGVREVTRWRKETGKPFGIYGITQAPPSGENLENLNAAKFVFYRDSISMQTAKEKCTCPIQEFGPDGAFAVDLRNDAAAESFMKANGLEQGKFLCCIPRLRWTPYWKIKGAKFNQERHDQNEKMKEHDHAPLRDAIIAVAKQTDMKVLLCPEDQSQMEVGKENLYDKLPDEVKNKVVWREKYWLTDEALSTYVRSAGLFGLEMHSPIMCIGNGIPALVGRFKEQTTKGFMWRDIGLGDWLFDMDNTEDVSKLVPTVLSLAKDPEAAKAKAAKAREFVRQRQKETMAIVAKG